MKRKQKDVAKTTPQDDFNQNIAAILSEAAGIAQAPTVAQTTKPVVNKPCIVFHGDSGITRDDIASKFDSKNYTVAAAGIKDDGSIHEIPMKSFADCVINNMEMFAIQDSYKQAITNGDPFMASGSIMDIRNCIADNIAHKAGIAVYQKVLYAIKYVADAMCDMISEEFEAPKTIQNLTNNINEHISMCTPTYAVYPYDIVTYISDIGAAVRESMNGNEAAYDNTFTLVYNNVNNAMVACAARCINSTATVIRNSIYNVSDEIDANCATVLFATFNNMVADTMDLLMQSLLVDAQVITNEIVIASASTYGTAELPNSKRHYYDYCDEF